MIVNRRALLASVGIVVTSPWPFINPATAQAEASPGAGSFPTGAAPTAAFTTPGPIRSFYISAEDRTLLALDLILPEGEPSPTQFPAVLVMTRYWRDEIGAPLSDIQTYYSGRGYATIVGDVRGTGASFGVWPYQRSRAETRDFTAVMDWIVRQPWSDGRIIGMGNSYLANTADWMAERNHPALKGIVPRFADFDPYADLYFPGGVPNAFMGEVWGRRVKDLDQNILHRSDGSLSLGVRPVDGPDGSRLLSAAIAQHAPAPSVWEGFRDITYRDDTPATWHGASMVDFAIASHADAVSRSGVSIQNWAGWRDAGTANGAIHRFLALSNPLEVIIGPWSHGGFHAADPFQPDRDQVDPTYAPAQQEDDFSFVERCLSKAPPGPTEHNLHYYTMGEGRWKTTGVWPLPETRMIDWRLAAGGLLTPNTPAPGSENYKVDFAVGTGPHNRWATNNDAGPVSYADRAEIDRRLLSYTSALLARPIEITGHPVMTLFVASTHTDGAFFAYLETVAPNGAVIYLTEGQLRGIHRRLSTPPRGFQAVGPYHSFLRSDAQPLVPGEIAELAFALHPLSVRVPAGYRLRVAISGADTDVFARVPAVGDPTLAIHYGAAQPSRITLPIIPGRAKARRSLAPVP
jgi:putative CocE/NonD family hydrolase